MKNSTILSAILFCFFILTSCSDDEKNEEINEINPLICIPANLQSNTIAFYPFSNGSLNDGVNSNILTNTTSAHSSSDRNSNQNCAFEFDSSSNDFVSTTNTNFLNNLSEFSVSLWFKPNQPGDGNYHVLLSRDDGLHCPDTNGQWSLGLYDGNQPVFGYLNAVWDFSWKYNIDYNNWHHLVATYNQVNNSLSIYRNGILRNSKTGIETGCGTTPTVQDIGDLIIGKFFDGKIDDIIIFNKELNQSQITALFEMDPCCQ
ncbi:LamG domain-containing protein [Mesonia maritima]|uniref:LamG-like jellyroll fold domain-containing protein n=1 Tax=Mesonia maritima TaxID=1793873 RepID=A0ABU1K1U2_9FLAO|nr:LamG domain-containing protein [Mesonia maritima]MDR6299594.1 hypothetical protein [Mesonia maritima]